MIIKFSVDDDVYELDMQRILNTEAIAVQKVTGMTYDEWLNACDEGDPGAITALVWIAMKRKRPELRYSDVEFPLREVWANREYEGIEEPEDPTPPAEAASD